MRRSTRFAAIVAALLTVGSHASAQVQFYLRPAPYGNDGNSGLSADTAVATLTRARDVVRAYRASLPNEPNIAFIVNVGGGVYELPETFVLEAIDSGATATNPMIYRAANLGDPLGATAVISGGTAVSGWTFSGGLWSAPLVLQPAPEIRPRDLYRATQGYQAGQRLTRARYPNVSPTYPYAEFQWLAVQSVASLNLSDPAAYWTIVALNDGCHAAPSIPQDGVAQDAGVEMVVRNRYVAPRQTLILNPPYAWTSNQIWLAHKPGADATNIGITVGTQFFLEGAKEWIDVDDEWSCAITQSQDLLYLKAGPNPNTATMVVPRLATLVRLVRTVNVNLEGLIFCYTNRTKLLYGYNAEMSGNATASTIPGAPPKNDHVLGGAVELEGASYCNIIGGAVTHTGADGIVVQSHVAGGVWTFADHNFIDGVDLSDIGGTAVHVGSLKNPFPMANNSWPLINGFWVLHTTVAGCTIRGYGTVFHDCAGIVIRKADDALISHNEIGSLTGTADPYSSRYSGIVSLGFPQFNRIDCHAIVIEYNHIHHVMSRLSDGGGIYTTGYNFESWIRNNWIHAMPRDPKNFATCIPNIGLYFDLASKGFHVESNLIEQIGNYGLLPTGCPTPPICSVDRIGTLQFNAKGGCCPPFNIFDPYQTDPNQPNCQAACQSMALPSNQFWPTDATLINYVDHSFAAYVPPEDPVPTTAYFEFSQSSVPPGVITIRQNAGP